jgi:hypothetical protein
MIPTDPDSCRGCVHFRDAATEIEAALPNLTSLSSAYAAVRSDDGLCTMHDRYVTASSICDLHVSRSAEPVCAGNARSAAAACHGAA